VPVSAGTVVFCGVFAKAQLQNLRIGLVRRMLLHIELE
jgi:hypothetical protein